MVSALWIERARFEPWLGTECCVLGQDTLLSQCLSPSRCINRVLVTDAEGNTAMDWYSIYGGLLKQKFHFCKLF